MGSGFLEMTPYIKLTEDEAKSRKAKQKKKEKTYGIHLNVISPHRVAIVWHGYYLHLPRLGGDRGNLTVTGLFWIIPCYCVLYFAACQMGPPTPGATEDAHSPVPAHSPGADRLRQLSLAWLCLPSLPQSRGGRSQQQTVLGAVCWWPSAFTLARMIPVCACYMSAC